MATLLYADKYRPSVSRCVVGADYAARELVKWLKAWKNKDTPRAFLLSGPPGIGKSLLVDLVTAENGIPNAIRFDSLKKRTRAALKQVEEAFGTRKVDAYFSGKMQRSKPGAVIMDDMDSMLTSADQGGIPQIVSFIKTTRVPVICICNDANSRSMQALRAKCQHVRMQRPTPQAIVAHLAGICRAESPKFPVGQMRVIATASGGDVRQAVNELQFALSGNGSPGVSMSEGTGLTVDRPLNPFDAASALFRQFSHVQAQAVNGAAASCRAAVPLLQASARAVDSDQHLVPLMVQENYLRTAQGSFDKIADAAEAMSLGDVLEGHCRRAPGIMQDARAVVAVAVPCFAVDARLSARAEFPALMSHTAEINRRNRTMVEMAGRMSAGGIHRGARELATEDIGLLQAIVVQPLDAYTPSARSASKEQLASVATVAAQLRDMHLTRLDWDYIAETADMPSIRAARKRKPVAPAARSALTRAMQPKVSRKRGCVASNASQQQQPPKKKARSVGRKRADADKPEEDEEEEQSGGDGEKTDEDENKVEEQD